MRKISMGFFMPEMLKMQDIAKKLPLYLANYNKIAIFASSNRTKEFF